MRLEASVVNGFVKFDDLTKLPENNLVSGGKIHFDVRLYDRIQILSMEIRRLLKEEKNIRLYLPNGRILTEAQLRKYMFTGDFDV